MYLIVFLLLINSTAFPFQDNILRVKLGWDFFKNDKPVSSELDAQVSYHILHRHRIVKTYGEKIKLEFQVKLNLDADKSYFNFRKKFKDSVLLKHEQGHVDLGIAYARKLKKALDQAEFLKKDYPEKIKKIFLTTCYTLNEQNKLYDTETSHGTRTVEQEKWELYIKKALDE